MGKISIKYLAADLRAVRDQAKNKRKNCANKVLERLGYTRSKSISIEQFDALLIRAIDQSLGISRDADVLLMAFGLMRGYHYGKITLIGDRRQKYLAESNYLETHPRKQIPYADATKEQKDDLEDNLRKAEDGRIELLAHFLSEQDIPEYIKDNIAPIVIPQPSYILLENEPEPTPADDDSPDEIDENTVSHPEDTPSTTGGQQDSRSKEKAQADASDPPPSPPGFKIHIGSLSIGSLINIDKKFWFNTILSWVKYPALLILVIVAVGVSVGLFRPQSSPESESLPVAETFLPVEETPPPVEELFPSEKEIVLVPGEKCPLMVAVLPVEAGNETLSFVSSDSNIVTVSRTGVLSACDNPETRGQPYEKVKITIQAESGVTETKTVVVNFAGVDPPRINKEIEAGFYIWHQIRLAGTKEWSTTVDAEIGDIVEIQIQYRNIGENVQENVQIRDVLPTSLRYVAGTTKLWNSIYDGAIHNEDNITTAGCNIGNYAGNSNAYIRFQAKVVEEGLVNGMNTLMNWAQAGVGDVTLQEATAVYVNKGE